MRTFRAGLAALLLAPLAWGTAGCKREPLEVSGTYEGTEVSKPPYITWNGKPTIVQIPGTGIAYIQEFEEEDLYSVALKWYCFYKGHWFVSDDWQEGPWRATTDVPENFLKIPRGHPRYRIVKHHPDYRER
jgi:hypothetical protein